jgi:hypothetical protein
MWNKNNLDVKNISDRISLKKEYWQVMQISSRAASGTTVSIKFGEIDMEQKLRKPDTHVMDNKVLDQMSTSTALYK